MTIAETEDSRQLGGTLTIDGNPFAKQAYSVELAPAVNAEGDKLTLLNGNVLGADESTDWTLNLGVVQDFDDPTGFLEFCRASAGLTVPFTWEPNAVDAPTFTGTCTVRAGRYGGATRIRLTTDVSFPVVDLDDPVYPV